MQPLKLDGDIGHLVAIKICHHQSITVSRDNLQRTTATVEGTCCSKPERLIACAVGIRVNQTEVYLVDAVLIIFDLVQSRKCHTTFSGIFALKHVCTQPTEHGIRPLPTPKRIFAVTPQKRVISQTADEAIFIAIAQKFIIARLAPLSVTPCITKEMVVAIATIKRVVALITCQVIIATIAI